MTYPQRPRRSVRVRGYDYSAPGAYFVTMCVHEHASLFGEIANAEMRLNSAGQMAWTAWNELPTRFSCVCVDEFIVMPNHIHGIIIVVGAQFIAPSQCIAPDPTPDHAHAASAINQGAMNRAPTLGHVVRAYKATSTRFIRAAVDPGFGWQRNYYEHIIRDETSLNRIREYIQNNPARWAEDPENPDAVRAQ